MDWYFIFSDFYDVFSVLVTLLTVIYGLLSIIYFTQKNIAYRTTKLIPFIEHVDFEPVMLNVSVNP